MAKRIYLNVSDFRGCTASEKEALKSYVHFIEGGVCVGNKTGVKVPLEWRVYLINRIKK